MPILGVSYPSKFTHHTPKTISGIFRVNPLKKEDNDGDDVDGVVIIK
jgi:hypothetical protein